MEDDQLIPAAELCQHHQVEMNFIYSLKDYGLIEITATGSGEYVSSDRLEELEKMIRLHYDLQVNMEGIDVILHLLRQLEAAQEEANELRNRLKFYR